MRYSATLLDHFLNPRNAGMMHDPDGVGEREDDGCGDRARFFLRAPNGFVMEARFQSKRVTSSVHSTDSPTITSTRPPWSPSPLRSGPRPTMASSGGTDVRRDPA